MRLFEQVLDRTRETERTREVLATMIDNMDDGIALMTPEGDDARVHFVNDRDDGIPELSGRCGLSRLPAERGAALRRPSAATSARWRTSRTRSGGRSRRCATPRALRFERRSASGHHIEVSYKTLENGTIISIHRDIAVV